MTEFQSAKAAVATAVSAGVWGPIVSSMPEHIPLLAMSGFCGGLSRAIIDFMDGEGGPIKGLGSVTLGVISGVFLWPVAQPMLEPVLGNLEMEPATAIMFGGLVTGFMGVQLFGFLMRIGRKHERGGREDDDNQK